MWRGYSDADSEISEDWESGSEGEENVSLTAKDWLKPATKSLHRLQEVKPSVYNIGLCNVNQLKSTRSKVRGTGSEVNLGDGQTEILGSGLDTLQRNRTAWGSSNSLVEFSHGIGSKQGHVRRRPESAKLTSAGRPPSGKRTRPQSAQPSHLSTQSTQKLPGMAILGNKYDPSASSTQHAHRVNSRCMQQRWVTGKNSRPNSAVSRKGRRKSGADNQSEQDVQDVTNEVSQDDAKVSVDRPFVPKMEKLHFSLPSTEDEGGEDMRIATERLLAMAVNRRKVVHFDENEDKHYAGYSQASETSTIDTAFSLTNMDNMEGKAFIPGRENESDGIRRTTDDENDSANGDDNEVMPSLEELLKQFAPQCPGSAAKQDGSNSGKRHEERLTINVSVLDAIGRPVKPTVESRKIKTKEQQKLKHFNTNNSNSLPELPEPSVPLATIQYGDGMDIAVSDTLNSSQDVETMMSSMAAIGNRGTFIHSDSCEENNRCKKCRAELRASCSHSIIQSEPGTDLESKINQSQDNLHVNAYKKCGNGSQSNKGTVFCSSTEKNYYEIAKSEDTHDSVKHVRKQLSSPSPVKAEFSEKSSETIEIIGLRTGSVTTHIDCHGQKVNQGPVSRQMHSAGHNLLRRPRTKSAPVKKALSRAFSLSSEVTAPRLVTTTNSNTALNKDDDNNSATDMTDTCSIEKSDDTHKTEGNLISPETGPLLSDHLDVLDESPPEVINGAKHLSEGGQVQQSSVCLESEEKKHTAFQPDHFCESSGKPDMKDITKKVSASVSMNKGHYSAYSRNFSDKPKQRTRHTERILPGYNIVTKKPDQQEVETEELLACRRLQDKLVENGVNVELHTLKRALLPPDGTTYYYESSSANELPKSNTEGLLSHPKVWLREEYRQLVEAKKALARANERMRLQREQEQGDNQNLKKTKQPKKKGKKAGRKLKRSKSVT